MEMKKLHGIVPALITPLKKDGSIDTGSLEKLLHYLLDSGCHGIFAAGMTGEGAALGRGRLVELTRACSRIIGGRVPLVAGVIEAGTARTAETAMMLQDAGADMLSTTLPCGSPHPPQEEILRHFEWLTSRTSMPWMVYGNTGAYGNITPETMGALARMPGIGAIKDTRSDFEGHLKNLMAVRGSGTPLLSGGEYLVGPGFLFGADGNISGAANLYPGLFVQLYQDALEGRTERVRQAAEKIARIHAVTSQPGVHWLAVFKYIGSRMGLMEPWCCVPLIPPDRAAKKRIDAAVEALEI